ncbi:hypothetical protein ACFP63_17585 [Oerskovia jenensis]|uniref:Uncharacterized protein n=1 Tax=Oerskovia jenensis TaxID=162169 RepID=A0ABS2LGP1_9CELL|nr:hypothetical protein [Oerskovia jenensis]MBM7479284.1 hypothetical protein [Oerskovia jenensis]
MTTILAAVLTSGAVSAYVSSRLAVDRHTKEHEALSADLTLFKDLSEIAPDRTTEDVALAAVVRARLRQRLTRALIPSQLPFVAGLGLVAAVLVVASALVSGDEYQQALEVVLWGVMLLGVPLLWVALAENRLHSDVATFLDTNRAHDLPRWASLVLTPDVKNAYKYLVNQSGPHAAESSMPA